MKGKLALVREADTERDLGQADFVVSLQQVLRSFDTARDHILVWRQPSGRLELPGEVIGAEMGDGSHLLLRRTAFEIFHDVLDDPLELPLGKYAARRGRLPVPTSDMTDQVNRQDSGK